MSLLTQAIKLESPETIPVSVNILPAGWLKYGADLQKLVDQYPQFFHGMKKDLSRIIEDMPRTYHKGTHVDEWGCVWENEIDGIRIFHKVMFFFEIKYYIW